MSNDDRPILVIGDELENGELVQGLLASHFTDVHLSCDPARHMADLAAIQPAVLVLAFAGLEASRQFLAFAHEGDATLAGRPHSSIVLCNKNDARRAFELCRQSMFYDYVMFWPVTHDGSRLPMAVLQALRNAGKEAPSQPANAPEAAPRRKILPDRADSRLAREGDAVAKLMRQLLASPRRSEDRHAETARREHRQIPLQTPVRRNEPQTVLFVDDDHHQHQILRLMLKGTDLTPVFSGTAAGATQTLATLQPGIILVDVNLPDGSGVDLIRAIKANIFFAATPIITVTGHRTRDVVFASIGAGAVDFIAKPFARHTLLAKIARAARPDPRIVKSFVG